VALAAAVLVSATIGSPVAAQPSSQWAADGRDELLKAAAVEALKKTLPGAEFAFNVADWGIDPLVAAATTPGTNEEKIDAWVRALGQAGVNAAFPAYGFVLAGGKVVIGGATYTVESMIETTRDQQILAILGGRGAGGVTDRVNNVISDTPFVDVLGGRYTLDNIGSLPRAELDRYWAFYVSQVRDLYGRANVDVVNTEVWPKLLALWETQRAKANLERVVGQLDRALAEAEAKASAAAQSASTAPFTGDLTGTWKWTCCTGSYAGTMKLVQSGDRLSGSFVDDGSTISGYVGVTASFSRTGSFGKQDFWLGISRDGKTMNGQILGTRDTAVGNDFSATKVEEPADASDLVDSNAPTQGTVYYVFVLKDIGLVAATPDEVRTRPVCQWTGGGPPPCTNPAIVEGTLGGPYASVDAARADMKTKLDCHRGYWGTFLPMGAGRAWLQNNIGDGDCRSVKQL
jgi:hypothetical protein